VSASDVIPLLREAKADRVPITAETCPHYLTFDAEQIPTGATEFKCAPPIRGNGNREDADDPEAHTLRREAETAEVADPAAARRPARSGRPWHGRGHVRAVSAAARP